MRLERLLILSLVCCLASCKRSTNASTSTSPGPAASTLPRATNSVGMNLRFIPSGSFKMSCADRGFTSDPQFVTLTRPYWIGETEVTRAQWWAVMGIDAATLTDPTLPVTAVSWSAAQEFCKRLSAQTGDTYRLPTEAEWEYACRAGSTANYLWGNGALGDRYSWSSENSKGRPHSVASLQPNTWGLFDMSGNVREWCEDWFVDPYPSVNKSVADPVGGTEPQALATGKTTFNGAQRVRRGGDFSTPSTWHLSGARDAAEPASFYDYTGFRVVREVPRK